MTVTEAPPETGQAATTDDPRARWLADARRVLGIAEQYPGMPLPRITPGRAYLIFTDIPDADAASDAVAATQRAFTLRFRCEFAPRRTWDGQRERHILTAEMPGGLKVDLVALDVLFPPGDAPRDTSTARSAGRHARPEDEPEANGDDDDEAGDEAA